MGSRSSKSSSMSTSASASPSADSTSTLTHDLSYYHYGGRIGFRAMEGHRVGGLIQTHQKWMSKYVDGDGSGSSTKSEDDDFYFVPPDFLIFQCDADQMKTDSDRIATKARLQEQLLQYEKVQTLPLVVLCYDGKALPEVETNTPAPSVTASSTTDANTNEEGTESEPTSNATGSPSELSVSAVSEFLGLSSLIRPSHVEICAGRQLDYDYSVTKKYRRNSGRIDGQLWVHQHYQSVFKKRKAKIEKAKEKEKAKETEQEQPTETTTNSNAEVQVHNESESQFSIETSKTQNDSIDQSANTDFDKKKTVDDSTKFKPMKLKESAFRKGWRSFVQAVA